MAADSDQTSPLGPLIALKSVGIDLLLVIRDQKLKGPFGEYTE